MAASGTKQRSGREPRLSVDRVLDGAVALADEIGVEAFTIRKLADALDVKPMTIYHHVPNKDAILDGMVDRVFAEIDLPPDRSGLEDRHAPPLPCRPGGAEPPPVGGAAHGVPDQPRARDARAITMPCSAACVAAGSRWR